MRELVVGHARMGDPKPTITAFDDFEWALPSDEPIDCPYADAVYRAFADEATRIVTRGVRQLPGQGRAG
jgi:hypothetical protein